MTGCHTNTATAPLSACHECQKKRCQFRPIWAGAFFLTSHFALLLFLFSSQDIISCSPFAFFVWTVTCRYLALKPIASEHAHLCAHPVIAFSPFQSHLTFVFSFWFSGRFFQSCFFLVRHMAILVEPSAKTPAEFSLTTGRWNLHFHPPYGWKYHLPTFFKSRWKWHSHSHHGVTILLFANFLNENRWVKTSGWQQVGENAWVKIRGRKWTGPFEAVICFD